MVTMNNPRELGKREIVLIEDALRQLTNRSSADPVQRMDARELLDLIEDSRTVWLDLNEDPDE